jgi:spore germination protein
MKKYLLILIQFNFFLFMTGCSSEQNIIDDIDLVTAVGYDYIDEGHVRGTVSIPVFKPDKTVTSGTFSNVSTLIRENRAKLDSETNKPLLSGKLELVLYNEELARNGIYEYLDYLNRDPSVGSHVYLAVVKGSTNDCLRKRYETQDTGLYISGIIEKNIKRGTIPKTNLHQLLYKYYSKGTDFSLPILVLKDDKVKINGMALFKKDKFVGGISYNQLFAFRTLVEDYKFGIYPLHIEKNTADLENINSKRHFSVDKSGPIPKVKIDIEIEGVIREYKGTKMNHRVVQRLERQFEDQLTKDFNNIISKAQSLQVDPFGIGNILNSRIRHFDFKRYRDYYPDMNIEAKVKVNITEFGVTQ